MKPKTKTCTGQSCCRNVFCANKLNKIQERVDKLKKTEDEVSEFFKTNPDFCAVNISKEYKVFSNEHTVNMEDDNAHFYMVISPKHKNRKKRR